MGIKGLKMDCRQCGRNLRNREERLYHMLFGHCRKCDLDDHKRGGIGAPTKAHLAARKRAAEL